MRKFYVNDSVYSTNGPSSYGPFWSREAAERWLRTLVMAAQGVEREEHIDWNPDEWEDWDLSGFIYVAEQREPGSNGSPAREMEQVEEDEEEEQVS